MEQLVLIDEVSPCDPVFLQATYRLITETHNTQCADCDEKYYDDGEPGMATCPNCGSCDRT
jgi:Zn finger protein HypA/HybF involved in hydrogenase expression